MSFARPTTPAVGSSERQILVLLLTQRRNVGLEAEFSGALGVGARIWVTTV